MSNTIPRIIIFSALLPLLLIVNASQSLASISGIKIAESSHLTTTNLEHQSQLSDRNVEIKIELTEALGRDTDQLLQSELLLIAARNEKTKECRVSGLCS